MSTPNYFMITIIILHYPVVISFKELERFLDLGKDILRELSTMEAGISPFEIFQI